MHILNIKTPLAAISQNRFPIAKMPYLAKDIPDFAFICQSFCVLSGDNVEHLGTTSFTYTERTSTAMGDLILHRNWGSRKFSARRYKRMKQVNALNPIYKFIRNENLNADNYPATLKKLTHSIDYHVLSDYSSFLIIPKDYKGRVRRVEISLFTPGIAMIPLVVSRNNIARAIETKTIPMLRKFVKYRTNQ